MKKRLQASGGFTLVELLIAVIILGFVLTGLIQVFIHCSVLTELSRNKTSAMSAAQGKMEEIRNATYSDISTDYISGGTPGDTFALTNPSGMGAIYVDTTNASLLDVKITVSWQNKYGRIIGEDLDLDGVLDSGEDLNSNGELDSIVTVTSLIAQR